ncbi:hypothetical protein GCM10025871_05500 [Deinococcus metallilatus]|nr:hypothetical protein GCM10025871_05500 [Deinococcus metallilatus]
MRGAKFDDVPVALPVPRAPEPQRVAHGEVDHVPEVSGMERPEDKFDTHELSAGGARKRIMKVAFTIVDAQFDRL